MTQKFTSPNYESATFWCAENLSKKATCPRKSVGCVIVRPHGAHVVGGYNGAPVGMPTCNEQGCLLEGGHCVRAVHAEMRAIANAAKYGINLNGCIAFCTLLPCINCMQALLEAGVREIHYDESYVRDERFHVHRLAELGEIRLIERKR